MDFIGHPRLLVQRLKDLMDLVFALILAAHDYMLMPDLRYSHILLRSPPVQKAAKMHKEDFENALAYVLDICANAVRETLAISPTVLLLKIQGHRPTEVKALDLTDLPVESDDVAAAVVKALDRSEEHDFACFVSEAWISVPPVPNMGGKDAIPDVRDLPSASKAQDRQKGIVVALYSRECHAFCCSTIERASNILKRGALMFPTLGDMQQSDGFHGRRTRLN